MSSDFLNYSLGIFFAILVLAIVAVLYRTYFVLGEAEKTLKDVDDIAKDVKEMSADSKEVVAGVKNTVAHFKEKIVAPIAGSMITDFIGGLMDRFSKNKRRKK